MGNLMGVDDFVVLTDQNKKHSAYILCVVGVVAAGMAYGAMTGGQVLPGAAGGLVIGFFMCKAVEEPLKKKLFSLSERMTK